MITLAERASNQILLFAPDLLGEALALQLNSAEPELDVLLNKDQLTRHPSLVIWSIESLEMPSSIQLELKRLQEHWHPSPVLLLLPTTVNLTTEELLQFGCPGLLQDPDLKTLVDAIKTLRGGGRVVRLKDKSSEKVTTTQSTIGLGQWLLISGLQQIHGDLKIINLTLKNTRDNLFLELVLKGRKREILTAKKLLLWLWGPLQVAINPINENGPTDPLWSDINRIKNENQSNEVGTEISLTECSGMSVWIAINKRLQSSVQNGFINSTGHLLAIDGLNNPRQQDLLNGLIEQLDEVINRLSKNKSDHYSYLDDWEELQPQLRQQALRSVAGSYVRLPRTGKLTPVIDELLEFADLLSKDDDLPDPERMLQPLLLNKPIQINGQLLPPDDPRSILHLETLFSNWIIRTAELLSAELLGACGEWSELRQYLLNPHFISTRELERLRNQLNSKNRWLNLVERPIQLYESKRLLYQLKQGSISTILVTEPRDEELRKLGWWQQQVALLVEARDALAPQVQALVRKFGDLMVIVLTQVIGRGIGLVGRGIAQGMGRSLGRG